MIHATRRSWLVVSALVLVALVAGGAAFAGDEKTIEVTGTKACGHCTLHKADLKDCQDMLVVKGEKGTVEYYLAKSEALEKFGHTCKGEKKVKASGTVAVKDGKNWLTVTKIEEVKG